MLISDNSRVRKNYFLNNKLSYANSVDPDQTLNDAAYDPGIYCLPMCYMYMMGR